MAEACSTDPQHGFFQLHTQRSDGTWFDSWNVRRQPTRATDVLRNLPNGTVVGVVSTANGDDETSWLQLEGVAGGWILQEMNGAGWRPLPDRSAASARAMAQRFAKLCAAADAAGRPLLRWAATGGAAGDSPHMPSAVLLFRMRTHIAARHVQLQALLADAPPSDGSGAAGRAVAGRVVRATFGDSAQRMTVLPSGLEVTCSNGPCTMVSAEVASVGVLTWIIENTGGNSCMLLGAVQEGFQANLNRAPDRPEWGINSAHGHDPSFRVVKCDKRDQFVVVANLDAGTLQIYQTKRPLPKDGSARSAVTPPQQVLDCSSFSSPAGVRLCICMYNGGQFTLLPDEKLHRALVPEAANISTAQSAAVALPLSAKLSLSALYAVLRQAVRTDKAMCGVAIGAIQLFIDQMAPQSLAADDDLQEWALLLQEMAEEAIGDGDAPLLEQLTAVLVSLVLAQGRATNLLDCVQFLLRASEAAGAAGMRPLVRLSNTVVRTERALRATMGIDRISCKLGRGVKSDVGGCSTSFPLTAAGWDAHREPCLGSNGTYLFVRTAAGAPELLKLGTGLNGTELGRVYARAECRQFGAECAADAWVGALGVSFVLLQVRALYLHAGD